MHGKQLAEQMLGAIAARTHRIGVIGLGYVGIPLVLAAAGRGFGVLGFDVLSQRVDELNAGQSPLKHLPGDKILAARQAGLFEATADFSRLAECDSVLIAVPTPLTKHRDPDLTFVVETTRTIAKYLRRGQLIVLESTTWPGTTIEVMKPILEAAGMKSGTDFFLAFSPEREDPGNANYGTSNIPKVVGGDGAEALDVANALYAAVVDKTVPVSSPSAAEAVKLTENIFRAVNIALVNELKVVFDRMGIDVWEVIDAAKTKPFGFMPFYPGPGLGGHCIPIDPFYLTWKAREFDVTTRFIELAGQINTAMPHYVVDRLVAALDRHARRGLHGARILIVGIAYKKNVDDMRESPSLRLIELIEARGAQAEYHDPHIPVIPVTREHAPLAGRRSQSADGASVANYDAVLIATDHDAIDWQGIATHAKLVIDTRNVMERSGVKGGLIIKA